MFEVLAETWLTKRGSLIMYTPVEDGEVGRVRRGYVEAFRDFTSGKKDVDMVHYGRLLDVMGK